ncbi:E3 ubiquitin/ISG15 ligase TRIM25-like isoform X2 [Triplophysa dalaica]|uniref:E3 ubiquitin/ISG15 ligase TRIM25-like isoform X2 n=1 Tax=Triplophysa dalaica TaxID=1582913 RepID=UPI0024DF8BD5|nr:E3 ubiquitin/ISG15 ligase TRIM25-like isoform X2 [Triplophysa dalaica]
MAEATFSEDQFCCSVCLDLLKDPVAIPCGHSYCMSCITGCWDQDDDTGVYSCPQCRETFTPRPVLNKNTILAEIVEKLKKTKLPKEDKLPVPAQCSAGSEDVECNVCTERKHKAVKSCLVCLNSYCENHLEQHEHLFRDKRHQLMDATGRLKELICYDHDRPLEVFCRTDQLCICLMCVVDKHKNHDTVRASEERTEKQNQVGEKQREFMEEIKQREKKLQELRDAVKSHKCFAQAAVEDSERIFTELIHSIEKRRSEVTQLIKTQETTAVSRAEGFMKKLEEEIADLTRRNAELEQLPHTNEDIHFVQRFQSLSVLLESRNIAVNTHLSLNDVIEEISLLKGQLEEFCQVEVEHLSQRVRQIQIVPTPEPKTREEFLQYYCHLSLDPNTAYKNLSLSRGNTQVLNTDKDLQYPDHPDRFNLCPQVLCKRKVYGRSYWEVEWRDGHGWVSISLAYKSIGRKGKGEECVFGMNNNSWRLVCSTSEPTLFYFNNKITALPCPKGSYRIGVFVDHSAGTLAFYDISNKMTLIHRVQTTFTQPLYPGFRLTGQSAVKLCNL